MLTLNTGSVCDVCAEEYGPHRRPHSITCGHVLCAACCDTIIEKTSPRLTPVCPFCREQFTSDSIRLIRLDFTSSGVSTPRRFPNSLEANEVFNEDLVDDRAYSFDSVQGRVATARAEARRLEDKVAKVAHKKCSVEEVHTLHEELTKWLQSEVKTDDQTSSLHLSAALLRAILLNHLAHSEATKAARSLESSLRARIDDLEMSKAKLEGELTKQKNALLQRTQECQTLRAELNRYKTQSTASSVGLVTSTTSSSSSIMGGTTMSTSSRRQSISASSISPPISPPLSASTSSSSSTSTIYPPHPYPSLPPLRPQNTSSSTITASASASASATSTSSASTTVHSPTRGTSLHTQLLQAHFRSNTPVASRAPHPPASPRPPLPPKPSGYTNYAQPTPTPPPHRMSRSTSEERDPRAHERWIPSIHSSDVFGAGGAKVVRSPSRASQATPAYGYSASSRSSTRHPISP